MGVGFTGAGAGAFVVGLAARVEADTATGRDADGLGGTLLAAAVTCADAPTEGSLADAAELEMTVGNVDAETGERWPLVQAATDTAVTATASDRRRRDDNSRVATGSG